MELRVQPRATAHVPWVLVVGVLLTAAVGIYNLASASRPPASPVWMSQVLYLGVGVGMVIGVALLDYRLIQRATVPLYLLNIGALIALKFFGHTAKGAESWFVIGPFRVQPAEFMKLGMVLMLAKYFHDDDRPNQPAQDEQRFTIIRHKLKKHQDARITGWLDPMSDLRGSNYHAMLSKIAVGSGGWSGKGWMEGTQTGLRFLPEQHTDFIFSVFAEEQGFARCLVLLALFGVILLGGLGVALSAKERYGAFVAVGICAMIFWQVFENIGMVTGLLPITGITLPLMSYGGSSMVSVMLGIGLLVNVSMRRQIFRG